MLKGWMRTLTPRWCAAGGQHERPIPFGTFASLHTDRAI
jgi:hypothetical protein